MNKIKARVEGLQNALKDIIDPPKEESTTPVNELPSDEPEEPVVVVKPDEEEEAPVDVGPADEDDGFADVVPTDLKDLVEENAPPLPDKSPFEQGTEVIPSGIEDLVADSESVMPLTEEPFENLLPNDAKDLLEPSEVPMMDIDDGEFEALK